MVLDRFPGRKDMNLLFNIFEASDEEKMGKKQKEKY